MKKKILFAFRYNTLNNIFAADGRIIGPADFLYGMNYLDKEKYEIDFFNSLQGRAGIAREITYWLEKPFSKMAKLSIAFDIFWEYGKKLRAADVIFCSNDAISLGILFWKKFGFIKADVVTMIQAIPERIKYFRNNYPVRLFISWLLRDAKTILTFTECSQADFVNDFKLDKRKFRTLPFGVDADFWNPRPDIKSENFIMSIGNDSNRDYQSLIEAMPNDILLKIITCRKIDSAKKMVEIFPAFGEEVHNLYLKSLFVVIPSKRVKNESPGQSTAMQAMACGKAVIIPRIPTMEEFFADHEHCLYYEPENKADLRDKIELLLKNPELREKIGAGGRRIILEKYTIKKSAERLEKIF